MLIKSFVFRAGSWRHLNAVDKTCSGIHSYVGFDPEMPAAVLLRAGHLCIAGLSAFTLE